MAEETRYDLRIDSEENRKIAEEGVRSDQLCFRINHTMPRTEESKELIKELFKGTMGEGSKVYPPIQINLGDRVHIGKNVAILYNFLCMSLGGITIGDGSMIAANVTMVTNNHDYDDRAILPSRPIVVGKNVWIGANATILPGVTIGDNAVVAAGAVVSKDVEANTVVAGVPAKVIKRLG